MQAVLSLASAFQGGKERWVTTINENTVLSPSDLMVWGMGVSVLQQTKTQQIHHSYQWILHICICPYILYMYLFTM